MKDTEFAKIMEEIVSGAAMQPERFNHRLGLRLLDCSRLQCSRSVLIIGWDFGFSTAAGRRLLWKWHLLRGSGAETPEAVYMAA